MGRTTLEMAPAAGGASRAVITGASYISDVQFAPDSKTTDLLGAERHVPARLFRASSAEARPYRWKA